MRIVRYAAAGLVGVCVIAVVSGSGSARAASAGWVRSDLRPVTQPLAMGGRFVAYAASGGGLRVVALSTQTGATVWSDSASTSGIAPGVWPELAIVDAAIVYLQAVRGNVSDVAARDPVSGRELWHSAPGIFTSWPFPCPGDTADVCVTGYNAANLRASGLVRLSGRTGAALAGATLTVGRSIGDGLYSPGQRHPELLEAVSRSAISWTRQLASIFPMPGASSDWGWNIDRDQSAGLFVGGVGAAPLVLTKTRVVSDLSHAMTAGFRISDGATVWRDPGATYFCTYLPCPGSSPAGYLDGASSVSGPKIGVSLVATGTVTDTPNVPTSAVLSADGKIGFEGFAPSTGRTLWRYDAGHDIALLKLDLPPQVGPNTVVLPATGARLVTLDLLTGTSHTASTTTPAWCRPVLEYQQRLPYPAANGLSTTHYIGQPGLEPCTAAGRPTPTPRSIPSFIAAIGARYGNIIAWSTANGIITAPA